jgi:nicotinamidase/pyrazinamidase
MENNFNKKKALLIIDVQEDFTGEDAKMPVDSKQAQIMIGNLNKIVDSSNEKNLELIYIGNEYSKYDILNFFRNFACIKGTDGTKMDKNLHIKSQYYFSKNKGNAFSNPSLIDFLNEHQISQIYISGLYAEACIYATVKGAIKNGFQATILTDCIATKTEKKRVDMIGKYKKLGVKTITSEQL